MTNLTARAERLLSWAERNPDHPLTGRDVAYFLTVRFDLGDLAIPSGKPGDPA